jgi:spoIIIJ-associated protein
MGLREFEGRDLAEAIREAASELGIDDENLHYEIVEQGRKGILGLGAKSVRIRIMPPVDALSDDEIRARAVADVEAEEEYEVEHEDEPEAGERAETAVSAPEEGEIAGTLERILELMGLEAAVRPASAESEITLSLDGADTKLLTQRSAELLHALQFLMNRMARRRWPDVGRIRLRAVGEREGRDRRDHEIVERAREIAREVNDTGRPRRTRPLNAYERRLVHLTVREMQGLASRSEGSGSLKRVRILKMRAP